MITPAGPLSKDGQTLTSFSVVGASVTVDPATDIFTLTAHGFAANHQVVFTSTGTLPTPLVAGTIYFVRDVTANTFKVAATSGGVAIDITSAGTGTHTVTQVVTWTTSGGTLSNATSTSVTWKAPNETGTRTLTATNSAAEAGIVTITVKAIIPNYWTWKTPIHAKKEGLIWRPIYGPTQSRGFGNSSAIRDWELGNDDSEIDKFKELYAFWNYHHFGRQFDLSDPVLEERRTYEIDSDLDYHYNDSGGVTWSLRIKEAYPYVVT